MSDTRTFATGQTVFNSAMSLMDELSESGQPVHSDTTEYSYRAPYILNILIQETYPFSDTFTEPEDGLRGVAPVITSLSDTIQQDDFICYSVLPYGLAAHLCMEDNPTAANYFQQRYEEMLNKLRTLGRPAVSEDIYDVYSYDGTGNGIGFEWTTRW